MRDEEEVVVLGHRPVDGADGLGDFLTVIIRKRDADPVLEQPVHVAVGMDKTLGAAVLGQLLNRRVDGRGGEPGIELLQRSLKSGKQDHVAGGFAPEGAERAEGFIEAADGGVVQLTEQGDGGLFDQGMFAEVGGVHALLLRTGHSLQVAGVDVEMFHIQFARDQLRQQQISGTAKNVVLLC